MDINLHIERLVLDGINAGSGQSEQLNENISSELAQLLSDGSIAPTLASGVTLKSVSASSIQLNNTKPQALGPQIAQSIFGEIGCE